MKTYTRLVILFLLFLLFCCVNGYAKTKPTSVMESFENAVPTYTNKSTGILSINKKRSKHGIHSLSWQWKGNDQLIIDQPIGYHKQRFIKENTSSIANSHGGSKTNPILEPPRGFFVWIYNTKASSQSLRFVFGTDSVDNCEFDFHLNFKGWRTVAIGFDRGDMRGAPTENMNRLTILAPTTGSGTLCFDMLGLTVPTNPRTVGPNPQLPEIDQHPRLVAQYPHLLYAWDKYKPTLPLHAITPQEIENIEAIELHFSDLYWQPYKAKNYPDSSFEKIKQTYDAFHIHREGNEIYGKPLLQKNILKDYFPTLSKDENVKEIKLWRYDYNYLLRDVSNLYHYTENNQLKEKLKAMFINLFDYGVDQGFDYGAGLGWLHHYSYVIREYGPAIYCMREVLAKHNRLEQAKKICSWFYATHQIYNTELVYDCKNRIAGNADELQGLIVAKLMTLCLGEKTPEMVRDLRHYSHYLSEVYTGYAQALDECFKPDGTIFHHAGHAFDYGGRAIHGTTSALYCLSNTKFRATDASIARMKKVNQTYVQQMFTSDLCVPKAFANIRFSKQTIAEEHLKIPALLALSSPSENKELYNLYAELIEKKNIESEEATFWKKKLEQKLEKPLKYNWSKCEIYPYTCVATQREKDNFLITTRGHSKYVYPFESWGSSFFAFPLFIANGYLDVSYLESIDSTTPKEGNWHNGYNWHRFPGTTSVNLPYEAMITDPGQVRDEGGEYLFSDQAFCGGVSSTQNEGIFAFQFKGHDKFGLEGFTGKKSYFYVGDMVLCMGSNICSNRDYNVETTLFQNYLEDKNETTYSNFQGEINALPFKKKLAKEKMSWLIDHRNTGYYLYSREQPTVLERTKQTNPDYKNKERVSGLFETAYISHGKRPNNALYKYILIANTNQKKMNAFAKSMNKEKAKPINIIKQDNMAHIAQFTQTSTTAYAVYAKKGMTWKEGQVEKVNKQATFLVREEGNELRLSVADPDLNIYDGQDDLMPDGSRTELSIYEREWFYWKSRPTQVELTLRGRWKIKEQIKEIETAKNRRASILAMSPNSTTIAFECRDGLSAEVLLKKVE